LCFGIMHVLKIIPKIHVFLSKFTWAERAFLRMVLQEAGQPADSCIASPAHPGTGHPGHVIRREIFYIICCKKSSESSSNGQFVDKKFM
jgi:hypothetical protein